MIRFTDIQKKRDAILFSSKANYHSNIKDYAQKRNQIIDGLIGQNKILSEFNFLSKSFVALVNTEECLGYKKEEFTISALNNDHQSNNPITHQEDIEHKIRYDNITYKLISNPYRFEALRDYYKLSFRVKHKDGTIRWAERSTYLFQMNQDNRPESQLDIWEISQNPSPFLSPSYYTPNYSNIMADFYQLNSEELQWKFTAKEKEILVLKNQHLNNKEIQAALTVKSIRTVEKHIQNMIKKTRDFFKDRQEDVQINSVYEVLNAAKRFGLFPFY